MPEQENPLTCEYCCNSPATQAFVLHYRHIGRDTALVCAPCGDKAEPHARRFGPVWRYAITPIKEKTDA